MPKNIPTNSQQIPIDGVLIDHKMVRQNIYIETLEKQAQQNVKQLLRSAQREVDILRKHGYQEGFQQGMLYALQQAASYLSSSNSIAWYWYEKLGVYAKDMLSAAVDHPETILLVLDEWLRNVPKLDATLYLTLPEASKHLHSKLMPLLMDNWSGKIKIDYHKEFRFVMRCGEQIAEFSPEQFLEPASRIIQQYLDSLPSDCRKISDDVLNDFISQCKQLN